jgi:hypothetical protein
MDFGVPPLVSSTLVLPLTQLPPSLVHR